MTVTITDWLQQVLVVLLSAGSYTVQELEPLVSESKEKVEQALAALERLGCITEEAGRWTATRRGDAAMFDPPWDPNLDEPDEREGLFDE
jgi:hypothetical protein